MFQALYYLSVPNFEYQNPLWGKKNLKPSLPSNLQENNIMAKLLNSMMLSFN